MQKEILFFADHMLKKLSRWLNILGFRCYAAKEDINDDEILTECKNSGKILLTKDRELFNRAKKREIEAILLRENKIENELSELFTKLDLKNLEFFAKKLCPFCSIELEEINKEKVKDKIPNGTYNKIDEYWICNQCNKLFWEGTHWDKIHKVANQLMDKSGVGGI